MTINQRYLWIQQLQGQDPLVWNFEKITQEDQAEEEKRFLGSRNMGDKLAAEKLSLGRNIRSMYS